MMCAACVVYRTARSTHSPTAYAREVGRSAQGERGHFRIPVYAVYALVMLTAHGFTFKDHASFSGLSRAGTGLRLVRLSE